MNLTISQNEVKQAVVAWLKVQPKTKELAAEVKVESLVEVMAIDYDLTTFEGYKVELAASGIQ